MLTNTCSTAVNAFRPGLAVFAEGAALAVSTFRPPLSMQTDTISTAWNAVILLPTMLTESSSTVLTAVLTLAVFTLFPRLGSSGGRFSFSKNGRSQ